MTAAMPQQVEVVGQHATIKLESTISGHLAELNGKYKLRVSEVVYQPGGHIGPHNHAGPGIRCITMGELTYVEGGRTSVFHVGDCFFEPGDINHSARNATLKPTVLLNFEILPTSLVGSSLLPVP